MTIPQNISNSNAPSSYKDIWTDLNNEKQSNILSDGKFLIGNASNIATEKAISGDATVNNAGALTIAPINLAGAKVTGILPNSKTTAEEYNAGGNVPFSIVSRNNFGELKANIANSADAANEIGTVPDTSTTTAKLLFVTNTGPSFQSVHTNSGLLYNAATNNLTATTFSGSLNGNASTASTVSKINGATLGTTTATAGNLLIGSGTTWETNPISGDITLSSAGVSAIGANKVTNAQLRQSAGNSIIGRSSNTTGNVADIVAATDGVLKNEGTALAFGAIPLGNAAMTSGILPVTKGGTGTSTAFTQNSIVFAGVGGAYSQNNTKLNWNNTTFRLGVNTTVAPNFTIEAAGAIAASNGGTRSTSIAYDNVNNWGTITSIEAAVGSTPLKISASNVNLINSNLIIETAGKGIQIKEGSNAKSGQSSLGTGGLIVVANTSVTANSRIQLTPQDNTGGGTFGSVYVSTRVVGVSFTITSTSATDRRPVAWQIFEPAP